MTEISRRRATAFAPATVANLGPGFDILGLAVEEPGDVVHIRVEPDGQGVRIAEIVGDGGRLPVAAEENTAAVAARLVLERAGVAGDLGVALRLEKGLPLGSGMGSSGASAAAGAVAANGLLAEPLGLDALFSICCYAEAVACGSAHGDNVAPGLWGGIVLLRPDDPQEVVPLPVPEGLWCALALPEVEVRTEDARRVLPSEVPIADAVFTAGHVGALVSALYEGDLARLGRAVRDRLHVPARSGLIPGFAAVHGAALAAGALAASVSGSGPTVFAFAAGQEVAERAAAAMINAFAAEGIGARAFSSPVASQGARLVD